MADILMLLSPAKPSRPLGNPTGWIDVQSVSLGQGSTPPISAASPVPQGTIPVKKLTIVIKTTLGYNPGGLNGQTGLSGYIVFRKPTNQAGVYQILKTMKLSGGVVESTQWNPSPGGRSSTQTIVFTFQQIAISFGAIPGAIPPA
jgi:hypothetical protein